MNMIVLYLFQYKSSRSFLIYFEKKNFLLIILIDFNVLYFNIAFCISIDNCEFFDILMKRLLRLTFFI